MHYGNLTAMMPIASSSNAPTIDNKRSQSEDAYQRIKAAIVSGEMGPGLQWLEPDLARTLGMSRTPIHEALLRLEHEGYVHVAPRRGMTVAALSPRDIREITEVLACLEVEAAERAAGRRLGSLELAPLDDAIAAMDRALEAKDLDAWNESDYRFHRLLIEASGNGHLIEVAHRFLEKANRYRTLTTRHRLPPVYSNVNHAAVVEAIRRGDPQSAAEIHRAHKRRWMHELSDILSRLNPMDRAESKR
jgi:DNA-binding GntR family transcriptional regulator